MHDHLEWKGLEYESKKRSVNWFWSVSAVALAAAALAIAFGNTLLGILIIVGTIALLLQTVKKSRTMLFKVDTQGVHIGKTLYPYQNLESFGMTEKQLFVRSKRKIMPYLVIPLPKEYDQELYDILIGYLPEEDIEEPVAEKIMEELGF